MVGEAKVSWAVVVGRPVLDVQSWSVVPLDVVVMKAVVRVVVATDAMRPVTVPLVLPQVC